MDLSSFALDAVLCGRHPGLPICTSPSTRGFATATARGKFRNSPEMRSNPAGIDTSSSWHVQSSINRG